MNYTIKESLLKKYNLSLEEFLSLLLLGSGVNLPELIKQMEAKDMIRKSLDGTYLINASYKEQCERILLEEDPAIPSQDYIRELAMRLRDIFPKGKKPGTNHYFKSNVQDTILRLATFFKLYGTDYTDEQIIDAAKRYVGGFQGDYSYMRILKYFIYKTENKGGIQERSSDLLTYLENEDLGIDEEDWITSMV